jgi:hypothetical protein
MAAKCAPCVVVHVEVHPGDILLGVSLGQRAAQFRAVGCECYVQSLREGALNDVPGRLGVLLDDLEPVNMSYGTSVHRKAHGQSLPILDERLPMSGVDTRVCGG